MQLPTAVCAASVLYSRSAGESEGPLPCGQGGGAPTSLTGVWRLDPGHFLCVGQMSEVHLLLKKAAHVYSPPFPCLTVVGRERGAGTSSTQIVVIERESKVKPTIELAVSTHTSWRSSPELFGR